jgi:hypothetical protein
MLQVSTTFDASFLLQISKTQRSLAQGFQNRYAGGMAESIKDISAMLVAFNVFMKRQIARSPSKTFLIALFNALFVDHPKTHFSSTSNAGLFL